jgi:1-acyl-sn-glycerol-3-phosphate acyltransferase
LRFAPSPASPQTDRQDVAAEVLELVDALVTELGGARAGSRAALDDSLERDLGLGSLERVELLVRLERTFGVRLPDAVMAEAATPRDLVAALASGRVAAAQRKLERLEPLLPGIAAPPSTRTLVNALRWHAERTPDRIDVLVRSDEGVEEAISYGRLWARATAIAASLAERGLEPGERVALMLRTEPGFFEAFFGVLLSGCVPVPIYPPFRPDQIEEYARRQIGILRNAGARLVVTFPEAERVAALLRPELPALRGVATVDRLSAGNASAPERRLVASDLALIQYTSGSTGEPKGVALTHANLIANITGIGRALEIAPGDVGASWLPLYHDMGLIGTWLTALWFGLPLAVFSPLAFLARPERWLRTIHAHRATISPAPNFAFELCVRRIQDADIEGLDLSSWRLALNGSEPVSPDTIERFTRRFAAFGFRAEAMSPVYGLAESSVALTLSAPGRGPRVDHLARARFQEKREALPASDHDPNPLRFVSCGRPLAEHEVRVVDAARRPLPERLEGRIEFRGPSVTSGYFHRPEVTRAVLHADGWMDSGDLGYLADGELFVTGRQKDMIIKAGRNLYPQEVEEVVGDIPGIRKGCVAAFGVPDPDLGTERLVIVAETRIEAPDKRADLRAAIVDRTATTLGVPPDVVIVAPPRVVLKTSSGKIRRAATRDAYLSGALERGRPSAAGQWVRLLAAAGAAMARRFGAAVITLLGAAWIGLVLLVAFPALEILLLLAPRGRSADRLLRVFSRGLLKAAGCRLHVEGLERLEGIGAAVIAPNHSSYVDALALLAGIPTPFLFAAKRELLTTPIVGTAIRKAGHLVVERFDVTQSVTDAELVSRALAAGSSLLVFPEGTFRRTPGLLPFRLGAFKAAVEGRRPIVPVAIRGTRDILPPDEWLPRPGPIRIVVCPPLEPQATGWPEMVRLRDATREAIARALDGA